MQKKILAICGSNSSLSINRQLMRHAMTLFGQVQVAELDLRQYPLPVFGVDIEKDENYLKISRPLRDEIMQADGYLFVLAEHNRGMTAFFKNAMDWASRVEKDFKILADKPALILTTSTGRGGGKNSAEAASLTLTMLGATITGKLSLPSFKENTGTDENGVFVLKLEEYKQSLLTEIQSLESSLVQSEKTDIIT